MAFELESMSYPATSSGVAITNTINFINANDGDFNPNLAITYFSFFTYLESDLVL